MTSPNSTQPAPDEILKQDQRGRVRTPVAKREALLNEYERSSLSGVKFAPHVLRPHEAPPHKARG